MIPGPGVPDWKTGVPPVASVAWPDDSRRPGRRSPQSFTLVELLVVVAIISILAALLPPSLRNARDSARQVACMHNERQLSLTLQIMASENNGWINGTQVGAYTPVPIWWGYSITNYLRDAAVDSYCDFVAGVGNKGCPGKKEGDISYSYGVNSLFTGGVGLSYPPCHSFNEVKNPTRIFLVADCYYPDPNVGSSFDITVSSNPPYSGGGYYVVGRHRGRGLNFVFVDGHGEFLRSGAWYNPPASTEWSYAPGYGIWAE